MKNDKEPGDSPYDQYTSSEVTSFGDHHLEAEPVIADKPDIEVNSEEPSGFISLGEYLRRERDLELVRQGEESKSCNNSNVDDSTVLVSTHSQRMAVSTLLPPKFELPRKETDFYMDKEITEVERPKVIICFQKDADQSIKDICIDQGNSNRDFQHTDKVESQKVYMISHLMENEDSEANKVPSFDCSESVYVENPFLSSDQKDCPESKTDEVNDNVNYSIADSNVTANVVPPPEESHQDQLLVDSSYTSDEIKPAEAGHHEMQFLAYIDDHKPTEADQDQMTVANRTTLPDSSTDTMNEVEISEAVPSNYHVQEGSSSLEAAVNTVTPAIADEKPNCLASELHQTFQGNVGSTFGQDSTDRTTLPRSSLVPCGQMEVVIHGPSCLSDRIIYAGQGAYSGSISRRSDSSTTSTRSFAFPILHSEWTSSPVKMAKPDRRHYKKYRAWRAVLLCCRF